MAPVLTSSKFTYLNLMSILKKTQPDYMAERDPWFKWHGSVIPKTLPFVVAFTIEAAIVAVVQETVWSNLELPSAFIPVVSFVVGLLLVFRTNSAYDRYYEGRRLWSTLTSTVRSAARTIWILAPEDTVENKVEKRAAMKLLIAYAYATKRHLRGEHGSHWEDIRPHLVSIPQLLVESKEDALKLPNGTIIDMAGSRAPSFALDVGVNSGVLSPSRPLTMHNYLDEQDAEKANMVSRMARRMSTKRRPAPTPSTLVHRHDYSCGCVNLPLEIANMLTAFVFEKRKNDQLHFMTRDALFKMISSLVETNASFERIITTPIPLAYNLHLKHTLLVYCFTLPFQLLSLGWAMIPAVGLAVAILWGIEHIGAEIENPFNYDANDLPLEAYCDLVHADVEFMLVRPPPQAKDWMAVADSILLPHSHGGPNGFSSQNLSAVTISIVPEADPQETDNFIRKDR
ncbi:hypothetical protein SmJEL517_g04609 [Synchytrium microbalum]|uniref:Uncharacterized protein n=1 Tax=Synchytrium microbalum TaxID=1806994 RepID=A0A507BYN4_9FUNG|nr:uncharacterized protein SmJEL517_g04609 [Synchytrium microbalum]TPX32221.1 hypothetical protein SmJEL517_g04609 [Synchytrium microbalum]